MIVEFESVVKRYGKVRALDGADLRVPQGSTMGLVGPNGAGKTTSMEIMTGLLRRDGGAVRVGGLDPQRDAAAVRRHVGYMPDFFGVYEGIRVREYLEFFSAAQRIRSAARSAVVADLLALVDLEKKADADVNTLSRGMKQRLSLARALIHDPELLILDEPASGLDPRARVELRELIAELQRMGRTVVISSHILTELEGVCTHFAIVDDGRVLAQGTADEVRAMMLGHRRVVARVPDAMLETAQRFFADRPEVGDIVVELGQISFAFSGDDLASADLLAAVIEAGVPVFEWRVRLAGLEEVFLHITENGNRSAVPQRPIGDAAVMQERSAPLSIDEEGTAT